MIREEEIQSLDCFEKYIKDKERVTRINFGRADIYIRILNEIESYREEFYSELRKEQLDTEEAQKENS